MCDHNPKCVSCILNVLRRLLTQKVNMDEDGGKQGEAGSDEEAWQVQ